jgi:SpoVK/Ycf46/Vps4 family AAA+-type ATPase
MNAERIAQILPVDLDQRFLILYGKGVTDSYFLSVRRERNLEQVLVKLLRERGFQRIVFFSVQRSIYTIDPQSRELTSRDANQSVVNEAAEIENSGPLGETVLIQPRMTPADNTETLMGDYHALRQLNVFMQDEGIKTAVVFPQAEAALRFFEDQRSLAGILGGWMRLQAVNPNVCLMCFAAEDYQGLCDGIERLGLPEISDLVSPGKMTSTQQLGLRAIGGPGSEEVRKMIGYVQGQYSIQVEKVELERLCNWLSAQDLRAGQWIRKMREVKSLSLEAVIRYGWIQGRSEKYSDPVEALRGLTGLGVVKQRLSELVGLMRYCQMVQTQQRVVSAPVLHMVFTGNPGTGKTTVARLFGEILHEIGYLRRGHTIEVQAADLIADHVGGTGRKTQETIQKALDGVLFIDEAYQLVQVERGGFGLEALDTLMGSLENQRERLVVIVAGYPGKMVKFMDANPGLRRRFPAGNMIHFPDFCAEELSTILEGCLAQNGLMIPADLKTQVDRIIVGMVERKDETFGNAGEMRNLADGMLRRYAQRVMASGERKINPGELMLEDIPDEVRMIVDDQELVIQGVLDELNHLVGLTNVKEHILRMVRTTQLEQKRRAAGLPTPQAQGQHLIFCGKPGTGKTTMARLIGKIYHSLGLLQSGHMVEVTRGDLVAGYVGQTAIKTQEKVREALDGVLFIDEGYSLAQGGNADYGQEAITTLLKMMEDYRKRLLVIVAGYPQEMEQFLNSNPGLRSRFKTPIVFPEYSPDELHQILLQQIAEAGFEITVGAAEKLCDFMRLYPEVERQEQGDARVVRKLVEAIKGNLAMRVMQHPVRDMHELNLIKAEDVPELPIPVMFSRVKV